MPKDIRAYRVFIASPGGLQKERKAFRDAIEAYNQAEAIHRGVLFIPVGWEDTLGGIGRPQSLINEDVRDCDYFVLVLWDRWGTPPDTEEKFTSGTEEEFHVAMECVRDSNFPMRQIVVFFRAVKLKQLADPGPQLIKVLNFRKKLEESKEHLFHNFDVLGSFRTLLSQHLGAWLRANEYSSGVIVAGRNSARLDDPSVTRSTIDIDSPSTQLKEAWRLADNGRRTEAETMFARAIVSGTDPWAFTQFGHFLIRDGRLEQAAVMFERGRELARVSNDFSTIANTHIGLGHVMRIRGDLASAEEHYRSALALYEKLNEIEGIANCYGNLGIVFSIREDLDLAEDMHRRSLAIEEKLGRLEGMASDYGNLGVVLFQRGELEASEEMFRKSLEIEQTLV